jgi:hypothetical protein
LHAGVLSAQPDHAALAQLALRQPIEQRRHMLGRQAAYALLAEVKADEARWRLVMDTAQDLAQASLWHARPGLCDRLDCFDGLGRDGVGRLKTRP